MEARPREEGKEEEEIKGKEEEEIKEKEEEEEEEEENRQHHSQAVSHIQVLIGPYAGPYVA